MSCSNNYKKACGNGMYQGGYGSAGSSGYGCNNINGEVNRYESKYTLDGQDYFINNKNYYDSYYDVYNHYYIKDTNYKTDYYYDYNVYHYSTEVVQNQSQHLGSENVCANGMSNGSSNGWSNGGGSGCGGHMPKPPVQPCRPEPPVCCCKPEPPVQPCRPEPPVCSCKPNNGCHKPMPKNGCGCK